MSLELTAIAIVKLDGTALCQRSSQCYSSPLKYGNSIPMILPGTLRNPYDVDAEFLKDLLDRFLSGKQDEQTARQKTQITAPPPRSLIQQNNKADNAE